MNKKRDSFPLVLHGAVSLLLPIPCFLITFVWNAFLAFLVPGASGTFVSALPMFAAPVFALAGVLRGVRRLRRRRSSRRAVACLVMCGIGIIEFIALFAYMSSVRL